MDAELIRAVKAQIKSKGLRGFAREIDVFPSSLSRWVSRERDVSYSTLKKVCTHLGYRITK